MNSHWKWAALVLIGLAAILITSCGPTPVCAPVYNVTKTADTNDQVCSAGDCSLREAVHNANVCPGSQTINLPAGGYTLTISGDDEDLNQTGDLDVTDDLVIIGSGAPSINGGIERAFQIQNGVTAQFEGIWLADGNAILGGGLINEGDLTLISFTCNYNSVSIPPGGMGDARGGCIFNTGNLVVQGGHFLANNAGFGGAIYNRDNATATIEDSSFTGNESDYHGGALWNGVGAELTLIGSTLEMNQAGWDGGAAWNHGDLFVEGTSFENNEALGNGGAVFSWMDTYTQFNNSWITGNTAVVGGGIYNDNGMMHFYESGVTSNTATGSVGGGIYNNGPIPTGGLLLKNVTVSGNTAVGGVGGAGIYNTGNFDLRFVTIANNSPEGLRIDTGAEIKVRSSILADNPGGDCGGIAPDSLDYNLDSDGSCGFSGSHDLSAVDPLLDPLGAHGSLAPSHPLGSGSPAIDSGVPDLCIANDQNFVSRPQGLGCDRGAFENPYSKAIVRGYSYIDSNRNDQRDPTDGAITGAMLTLKEGSCPGGADVVDVSTSSPDGYYQIAEIDPGDYCLARSPIQQTLYPDFHDLNLAAGDILEEVNFRYLLSPLGDASLSGLVWHDECAVPYGTPPTPPAGCISLPGGGLGADGIYDVGEPGIAGVRVDVYGGGCPAMPGGLVGAAYTDTDGTYTLGGLEGGSSYCVVVDALASPNDTILIPGNWTYPDRYADPAQVEVTPAVAEDLEEIDFGWDYQFLPEPPIPYSALCLVNMDAFIRSGDSTQYPKLYVALEGDIFEVLAKSASQQPVWYFGRTEAGALGWMSDSVLTCENIDPEQLYVRQSPPLPEPEPAEGKPLVCRIDLPQEKCLASGGKWVDPDVYTHHVDPYCECP